MEAAAQMELTRQVLQVKAARKSATNGAWSERLGEMESALCPKAKWVHEVAPDWSDQI